MLNCLKITEVKKMWQTRINFQHLGCCLQFACKHDKTTSDHRTFLVPCSKFDSVQWDIQHNILHQNKFVDILFNGLHNRISCTRTESTGISINPSTSNHISKIGLHSIATNFGKNRHDIILCHPNLFQTYSIFNAYPWPLGC